MAASLSSPQPARKRKPEPKTAKDDLSLKNFMTSMTLPSLQPRQGGKAERILGDVAEHQPVPGPGLVEPPHLLFELGQPVVKFRARHQPQDLDCERLVMDGPQLLEGSLEFREQPVGPAELGDPPRGPQRHPEPVEHDPIEGLEGM